MKALITGASSGLGRDIARRLSARGYDLILVARRADRLEELKKQLPTNAEAISLDLSKEENCRELYERVKDEHVEIVINNAGFGLFGRFDQTDLDTELRMIDTNIKATHILTKLFLRDFIRRGSGKLLNVASSAAFLPGPLMAAYYASKAYVYRLTLAAYEEVRRRNKDIYVGVLCPGPFHTEFNQTADVVFNLPALESRDVARCAVDGMFRGKTVIIPGALMKGAKLLQLFPDKALLRLAYHLQRRRK